jgi:hypothetical protein
MKTSVKTVKRTPPTPEQIRAQQKADAERSTTAIKAALPTKPVGTAIVVPDNRTSVQRYLDEVAPASIVGRMIKFGKDGTFETPDDGEKISDAADFVALCDQTLVGWIKFNGEGNPPDKVMGLLYDGFVMPPRETLGDTDEAQWENGLDNQPADPWQHQNYLVLQRGDTGELFTYVTSSKTGRRAVGNLLRHFDRMERARSGMYPVVRLKVGGFNHRDERIGWVAVPVLAVVGRHKKDDAAQPDSSTQGDMNDSIPF